MEKSNSKRLQALVIDGALPGLNDYISAERTNRYRGAAVKKQWTDVVAAAAKKCMTPIPEDCFPVTFRFRWYEQNRRRDKDNVSAFGRKVILDGLVQAGILPNDNWNYVDGFQDEFYVDRDCPRVRIEVYTYAE